MVNRLLTVFFTRAFNITIRTFRSMFPLTICWRVPIIQMKMFFIY
jgi:hypothetical protein